MILTQEYLVLPLLPKSVCLGLVTF